MVQSAGSIRLWDYRSYFKDSRIDDKARQNISVPEYNPFQAITNTGKYATTWFRDFGGHSLHNNPYSESFMVMQIARAFQMNDFFRSATPVYKPAGLDFMNYQSPANRLILLPKLPIK